MQSVENHKLTSSILSNAVVKTIRFQVRGIASVS